MLPAMIVRPSRNLVNLVLSIFGFITVLSEFEFQCFLRGTAVFCEERLFFARDDLGFDAQSLTASATAWGCRFTWNLKNRAALMLSEKG